VGSLETFSRGSQTFLWGPSAEKIFDFFLKKVHFSVLYISERRRGPKRRETEVYSLPPTHGPHPLDGPGPNFKL